MKVDITESIRGKGRALLTLDEVELSHEDLLRVLEILYGSAPNAHVIEALERPSPSDTPPAPTADAVETPELLEAERASRRKTTRSKRKVPRASVSGKRKKKCPDCGEKFAARGLEIHRSKAHGSKTEKKPRTPKKPKEVPPVKKPAKQETLSNPKPFKCPDCGREFGLERALTRHRNYTQEATPDSPAEPPARKKARTPIVPSEKEIEAEDAEVDVSGNVGKIILLMQHHFQGVTPYASAKGLEEREVQVVAWLDTAYRLTNFNRLTGRKLLQTLWQEEYGPEDRVRLAKRILKETVAP